MSVPGLRRRLLAWWDRGRRPLPWRSPPGSADPYLVWIAEVMSQQTRVAAAAPYFERFVARFPTLASLAGAEEGEVLALWSGLGYYARARRLPVAAREALRRHGGLPPSVEALEALPGLGPYTAGAIASIAFGLPVPAVDGNATRVLSRIFLVGGAPESAAFRARIRAHAASLAASRRPGDVNQALMELGATICVPRRPRCERCPAGPVCRARAAGKERELPRPRRRRAPRPAVLACAILRRNGRILLARRPAGGLFGGLWAPPAFEAPAGEDPGEVIAAGLSRMGLRASVGGEVAACARELTHRVLSLRAHECGLRGGRARGEGLLWAAAPGWGRVPIPSAFLALLELLEPAKGARRAQARESA